MTPMTASNTIPMFTGSSSTFLPEPQVAHSSTATQTIQTTVGPQDILCGRCKTAFHNVGNRRFRVIIQMNLQAYMQCHSKPDRSKVIASVANTTRECGARFLRQQKDGTYKELNNRETLQKVGHALRDMAVAQQRSTMAEQVRRQQREQEKQIQLQRYELETKEAIQNDPDEVSWTSSLESMLSELSDSDSEDDEPLPLCINL